MANWLLKTEPDDYSWDDLARDGRTVWDGITNNLALMNLRRAARGDRAAIYHTGVERRAVGIARVVRAAYPDPAHDDPKRLVIDIEAVEPLPRPVPLEAIKADPAFEGWDLIRIPRLSFVPVPAAIWRRLMSLGGVSR